MREAVRQGWSRSVLGMRMLDSAHKRRGEAYARCRFAPMFVKPCGF